MFKILLFVIAVSMSPLAAAGVSIASWNIERMGGSEQKSFAAVAELGARFDFLAVQEAMTAESINDMRLALESRTDEPWRMMHSHAIGRGSYKERYAFLWRESAVEYVDGAVVYLDRSDQFAREPYSARFRSRGTGAVFAVATVHVLYGKTEADRVREVQALAEYWAWLQSVYAGSEILLTGDFNLAPSHPAWAALKVYARPVITRGATTVSSIEGRFANLYDNIWISTTSRDGRGAAGVLNGPRVLGMSHKRFREVVSDHVPVYLALPKPAGGTVPMAPTGGTRSGNDSTSGGAGVGSRVPTVVVGNRGSMIYHLNTCPSYGSVSNRNRAEFPSEAAAAAAGFRKAKNCS